MKKLAFMFLLVAGLLTGTLNIYAAGDGGAKKSKGRMRYVSCANQTEQIKSLIGRPDVKLDKATSVQVNFSISSDNVISINEIKTDNVELEKMIYNKLQGMKINGNEVEMTNQTISLVFRVEQDKIFLVY